MARRQFTASPGLAHPPVNSRAFRHLSDARPVCLDRLLASGRTHFLALTYVEHFYLD
jgi:hypothetical protein